MNNILNYYYNLFPDDIEFKNNIYSFKIDNELYHFKKFDIDLNYKNDILNINQKMIKNNIPVHEIIKNNHNDIITIYNETPYILYKVYININKKISLSEIYYLNNFHTKEKNTINWLNLWENRIDYLENQIYQIGKKYPIILDSFSYYIGLAENAISYLQNTIQDTQPSEYNYQTISHRRINKTDTIYSLYDPLNIIMDNKTRDLAEYIKFSFLNNDENIFNHLNNYFKNTYYSLYDIKILFARIIYPNFYFDQYDLIIQNIIEEKEILKITTKTKEYELFITNIFNYLNKFYNLPKIDWLIKK